MAIASGPLAKLYNKSIFTNLQYPRDLQNKPHSVKFTILLPGDSSYKNVVNSTQIDTAFDFTNGQRTTNITQAGAFSIINTKRKIDSAITLYMPDTVNMTYGAAYQEDNLSDYKLPFYGQLASDAFSQIKAPGKDLYSGLKNAGPDALAAAKGISIAGQSIDSLVPIDVILQQKGLAINPQVQVLFKAVALRTFQFEFLFTPYSQEEAANVQEIIKAFKFHAAPEVGRPAGADNPANAIFFVVPSTFEIEYQFNGKINENINRIGECVLESVTVDYATNGWVTFEDGSPVQTRMTLQFKEIEIVDKAKVDQGF
jgi:hypothetical protein